MRERTLAQQIEDGDYRNPITFTEVVLGILAWIVIPIALFAWLVIASRNPEPQIPSEFSTVVTIERDIFQEMEREGQSMIELDILIQNMQWEQEYGQ